MQYYILWVWLVSFWFLQSNTLAFTHAHITSHTLVASGKWAESFLTCFDFWFSNANRRKSRSMSPLTWFGTGTDLQATSSQKQLLSRGEQYYQKIGRIQIFLPSPLFQEEYSPWGIFRSANLWSKLQSVYPLPVSHPFIPEHIHQDFALKLLLSRSL